MGCKDTQCLRNFLYASWKELYEEELDKTAEEYLVRYLSTNHKDTPEAQRMDKGDSVYLERILKKTSHDSEDDILPQYIPSKSGTTPTSSPIGDTSLLYTTPPNAGSGPMPGPLNEGLKGTKRRRQH
jgi:hypothetical protein